MNKVDYRGPHTFYISKGFINNNENISIYRAFADKLIADRNDLLNFKIHSRLKFDIFDVYKNNTTGENSYQTSQSLVKKLFSILRDSEYKEKYFKQINYTEYCHFEKTKNAGLTYCNPGVYTC